MAAMKENAKAVLNFLKELSDSDNYTAQDVADTLGMPVKSVNGIITAALVRKGYAERVETEIEIEDENGKVKHKTVKFIKLTQKGKDFDPDAEVVAVVEEATE